MGGANTIVGKYAASAVATPPSGSANLAAFQAIVSQLATPIITHMRKHGIFINMPHIMTDTELDSSITFGTQYTKKNKNPL